MCWCCRLVNFKDHCRFFRGPKRYMSFPKSACMGSGGWEAWLLTLGTPLHATLPCNGCVLKKTLCIFIFIFIFQFLSLSLRAALAYNGSVLKRQCLSSGQSGNSNRNRVDHIFLLAAQVSEFFVWSKYVEEWRHLKIFLQNSIRVYIIHISRTVCKQELKF